MRRAALFLLPLLVLAACDSDVRERQDDDLALALRALPSSAALVLRFDTQAALDLDLLSSSGLDVSVLLDSLTAATGIAAGDVRAVYAALNASGSDTSVVAVTFASYGASEAASRLTAAGFAQSTYAGTAVFSSAQSGAFALQDGLVLAASSTAEVRAALDRLNEDAPSLASNEDAARLLERVSEDPLGLVAPGSGALLDVLLTTLAGGEVPLSLPIAHAALAVPAQQLSGATSLRVTAWLTPEDGTAAQELTAVLSFAVNTLKNQPGLDAETAALLNSVSATAVAPDVRVTLRLPLDFTVPTAALAAH